VEFQAAELFNNDGAPGETQTPNLLTAEFSEQTVTHELEDAAVVPGDLRLEQLRAVDDANDVLHPMSKLIE
jgi:hypothetical protein